MASPLSGLAFLDSDGKIPAAAIPAGSGVTMGQVYPVGSVYLSVVSTNPATLLGIGTWSQIAGGKMLIGQGNAPFDAAENTGGSSTATPTGTVAAPVFTGSAATSTAVSAGTPAGTNSTPAFTGSAATSTATSAGTPAGSNSAPAFTGTASQATSLVSAGTPAGTNSTSTVATATGSKAGSSAGAFNTIGGVSPGSSFTVPAQTFTGSALSTHQHTLTPAGTVAAPTFTGSALATHTHDVTAAGTVAAPVFTGSALGTHAHSVTATGTNSAPAFTGSSGSVLNPYLVVYVWKRVS